ncbi:MAG TPA: RNA polymerase sigma factor [Steroidobacteraceae bacterium]
MQARVAADTETDEGLMLAWQAGNAAAFDRLYARHRGGVFRYLLRHCGNRASAEELHQDVWLRLIAARPGYRATARFATWLYTVARNRLIDHWRAAASQRLVSLDVEQDDGMVVMQFEDPAARADPMRNAASWQDGRRIVDALQALPGAQRDAFLLHVEGGLALTEIAALTGAPAETVKSRLRYAYARLRDALGDLQ